MRAYNVFFGSPNNTSSKIKITDIESVGMVKGQTPQQATRRWNDGIYVRCKKNRHRRINVGDVLNYHDDFYLYTANGIWALIEVIDAVDY